MTLKTIRTMAAACVTLAALSIANGSTQSGHGGLPLAPSRVIEFTTREGTWMSVDVHPDGKTIVFDHLGDIYLLPVQGGTARRIAGGMAFDTQPRFSPDGQHIAFVSDRSGWSAVWTMRSDGTEPRQLSPHENIRVNAFKDPAWAPDGSAVVALTSNESDGSTRVNRFAFRGDSAPVALIAPAPDKGITVYANPTFSPDGHYLYLSVSRAAGKDVLGGSTGRDGRFDLARLDTRSGTVDIFPPREGGSLAPLVSHSGDFLIYAARDYANGRTGLRRFKFDSGADRALTSPVQLDMQENGYVGTLPSYALTADDRAVVLSHSGKLWRVDVGTGQQTEIPFEVNVRLDLGPLSRFTYSLEDSVDVRSVLAPTLSPDGETLAFASTGAIWLASTRTGKVRRLTPPEHRAQEPAWSPDGTWVAYATWEPTGGAGALWRVRTAGNARPVQITSHSAQYCELVFSPDGSDLLARACTFPREFRNGHHFGLRSPERVEDRQPILRIPLDTGEPRTLTVMEGDWGLHGTFHASYVSAQGGLYVAGKDARLYFRQGYSFHSMKLDGTDRRIEAPWPDGEGPSDLVLSPQANRALRSRFARGYTSGVTLEDVARDGAGKLVLTNPRKLREISHIQWSADGRYFWGFEDMRFVRYERAAFERDPRRYRPYEIELTVRVPTARPTGTVVLRGARVITMRGDEIIERGDVVVSGNRIAAVGASGSVTIPRDARIIDVAGRTLLPGWVDIHSHDNNSQEDPARATHMAEIAYGITAIRDPSPNIWPVPAWDDIAAGLDIGPRAFSTGPSVQSLEGASDEYLGALVRRYAQGMRTQTFKQYRSGGRNMRQRIVALTHEFRLTPTAEALDSFWDNISLIIDGYGGVEHTPGITPYYDDVVQLVARSGTVWTPTLAGAGPDSYPDDYLGYLLSSYDLYAEARFQRFVPRIYQYFPRDIYRVRAHDRYMTPRAAADAARVVAAGGRVGLGSHGSLPGLGVHLELWTLASGGMPLHDVLRVGTIFSADAIGHGAHFGSIEPGKLADLQVLDRNPLEDIRNTLSVSLTMANGFLYEAATLNEVWPRSRPLPKQWWQE